MSTTPIDYAALAEKVRQSSPKVDYVALAEKARSGDSQNEDYAGKLLQNASISAPESGIAATIDRFKNKVKTALRGNTGSSRDAAVDFAGGPILGPLQIAHGAAITPEHPIRGTAEQIRGVGQTLALPLAVVAPEATAMSLPRVALGTGVSSLAKEAGLDPDAADILGFAAAAKGPELVKGTGAKIAKVAGKAASSVDPDIVGLISPRLAHAQRLAGKVANIAGKLSPSTMEPPPFPGPQASKNPSVIFRDVATPPINSGPKPPVNLLEMSKQGQPPPFPETKTELSTTPIQDAIEKPAPTPEPSPTKRPSNLTDSGNKQRSNLSKNQKQLATADPELVEKYKQQEGEQGGHAGSGVSSVEELNRPGKHYVVPKAGFPSARGVDFDPGSTPSGATHVTVLKKATMGPGEYGLGGGYVYKINDGQQLSPAQYLKLKEAVLSK